MGSTFTATSNPTVRVGVKDHVDVKRSSEQVREVESVHTVSLF
jgi:hypothetical protein